MQGQQISYIIMHKLVASAFTRTLFLNARSFASKKIIQGQQCRSEISKITAEIQKIAEITLGPYGRTVLIQSQMQSPRITKDGITVVKHIEYENRLQDAICMLVKKSVDGTNKFAGDGTTTSTVLIGEIMKRAYRKLATGAKTRDIRKGFEVGRKMSIQFLDACSQKISNRQQLMNVAMVSTNGKIDIANLVVDAVFKGKTVRIEKSQKQQNTLQVPFHSGLTFPRGFQSKQFINQKNSKLIYNYPLIVTSLQPVNQVKQIIQCLELAKKARKQIMVFAPEFSEAVKSTFIFNNKKKTIQCSYVTFPYGDKQEQFLKKISNAAQSYLFHQFSEHKLQNIGWDQIGKAVKIQSDQFQTRMQVNKKEMQKNLQAVIMVGGPNETVLLENYDHIVDALNSTKSAMKDGVVAGGGVTYWRLAQLLEKYTGEGEEGVKILAEALKQPRKKLMQYVNSEKKALSGEGWQGYDLKQQKIVDMFQAGIMDSVNVAKSCIIDSLSLCTVLVEVEVALARIDRNISTVSLKQLNDKYKL